MGYLNNTSITVDAILTDKGRQYLASNQQEKFAISYFALGDDEINYDLWNPAHPLGSDYYGIVIENMPLLEAFPISDYNLKSKLVTLPQSTQMMPKISNVPASVTFNWYGGSNLGTRSATVKPILTIGDNSVLGYTCFYNPQHFTVMASQQPSNATSANTSKALGDSNGNHLTEAIVGTEFKIMLNSNFHTTAVVYTGATSETIVSPVIFVGNQLGGRSQMNISIVVNFPTVSQQ